LTVFMFRQINFEISSWFGCEITVTSQEQNQQSRYQNEYPHVCYNLKLSVFYG
jgi:hypothetical protein